MQLSDRLSILKTIMLRRDLSAAAKTLAWFLLLERMNANTSLCYSKNNATLAADLAVDVATIERAARQLRQAGLLDWTVDHSRKIAGFRATYFRFNKTGSYTPAELRVSLPQNCGTPAKLREQHSRNPAGQQTKNTPAEDTRVAAGLRDLSNKLKAAPPKGDDATQFKHWKSDFQKLGLIR